jgi:hypothetical protein
MKKVGLVEEKRARWCQKSLPNEDKIIKQNFLITYLRTLADESFSMLSKNLFDLAQAFETLLLVSY